MYGKIFQSMYDGTIAVNWKGLVTFQQMIVLCESDGVIDITPPALSKRTGIPLDIIEDGIEYLSQPDPYSRSQEHEGRRIILLDEHRPWGWVIVNHEYYRDLASVEDRREKAKLRKQKQREKEGEKEDVTPCHTLSRVSRHTDTDTDTLKEAASGDDPKNFIWEEALRFKGITRTFLGKLCKEYSENNLVTAIMRTKDHCPADPKSFLVGVLKADSTDFEKGAI